MTTQNSLSGAALLTGDVDAFRLAGERALAEAEAALEALRRLPAEAHAREAMQRFDEASSALSDAGARAGLARSVHPDAALREAAEALEQEIEKRSTAMALDRALFDALARGSGAELEAESRAVRERTLRDFRRAGVDRDEATRSEVKRLNEELVALGQTFSRNIRDDVRRVRLPVSELAGLPEDWIRAHAPGADGLCEVTTDGPDLMPFMTWANSSAAREQLWRVARLRGHPVNAPVLAQILERRRELAALLGHDSWAAYATDDKMIGSAKAAGDFIEKIANLADTRMKRDLAELLAEKQRREPGATQLFPWESAWLEDKVKAGQYAFDSQSVRPYFAYARVKQGVLDTTARLFGLRYTRIEMPVWHPRVEAYEVHENGNLIGRFLLDMHPREQKYKHAAQFTLTTGVAGVRVPEAVLVCNFPEPTEGDPGLMVHDDVVTFFHEFGHLLHHILGGQVRWGVASGVRTEWDFVEAPSQLLEEWAWEPEVLAAFALHHETNQPIPAELVTRMRRAEDFGKGVQVRQQMFYAALSLELHRRDPRGLAIDSVVRELQNRLSPYPWIEGTAFHLSFGHLEGYSALYYTYMWSLVLAKDFAGVFRKGGFMDPEVANRYRREVLAPGGSKPASALAQAFLGRAPEFAAWQAWLEQG